MINNNKKIPKVKTQLDEKSKKADDKRKESLQKMNKSYDLQKSMIKNALAGIVSLARDLVEYHFRANSIPIIIQN